MGKPHEHIIRNFGMANTLAEVGLDKIERKHDIDFGRKLNTQDKDETYYPQFGEKIRDEATSMSSHYEIFYCLENSIREIIKDRLVEYGENWWEEKIPEQVRVKAKKRQKDEISRGVTRRSDDLLAYTSFGELGTIIDMNWEKSFSDMFTDKAAVRSVITMLNTLRGPIAHCSPLAEDEVTRLKTTFNDWFRLME